MKFVLAYTICSMMTGMCHTTMIHPERFDTWTDCVKAGATQIIYVTNKYQEKFEEQKLYLTYFCNENHSNKTTTQSKSEPSKVQSSYIRS